MRSTRHDCLCSKPSHDFFCSKEAARLFTSHRASVLRQSSARGAGGVRRGPRRYLRRRWEGKHRVASAIEPKTARPPGAREIEIRQSGQRDARCPVVARKIFRLTRRANQRYQLARPARHEGRFAIVTNVRRDAVDATSARDERSWPRTVKSCGPGAPTLALSSASHIVERRWQESPVTGESTK